MLLILSVLVTLPDATRLRPERLLAPGEVTIDGGVAGAFSQTTKGPAGQTESQPYEEVTVRVKGGVGITHFLRVELTLPLLDAMRAPRDDIGIIRFGDPTLGIAAGGRISTGPTSELHLAPIAEVTFPTARETILRPRPGFFAGDDRGIVVTTGGVTATLGAMGAWVWLGGSSEVRLSLRGFYRVRSNDAAHGAGADARVWAVLLNHLILGGRVDFLTPFFGLAQSMISPSRLADPSGWLDLTLSAGYRVFSMLDLVAAFSAPLYIRAGSLPLTGQLLVAYAYQP